MEAVQPGLSRPLPSSVAVLVWASIALIFGGIFLKDILSFYFFDYSLRNTYGAASVLLGGFLAVPVIFTKYGKTVFLLASNWLLVAWAVSLLIISPITAYFFNDKLFISPQAVGYCAALTCFLVSQKVTKKILASVLLLQFIALIYEYHYGVSITVTMNEAKNIYFREFDWLIDPKIGLIRAKGMLDSTHDSTWLFFYSSLIFDLNLPILVSAFCAGWMAQGRLAIMAVVILCLASRSRVWIVIILAAVATVSFAISPSKISTGVQFFLGAFDPTTSSNTYRVQATNEALSYLKGDDLSVKADDRLANTARFVRMIVGASGSALGSGKVLTEMGYTLFAIEYGVLGLVLMAWLVLSVAKSGYSTRNRSSILLGIFVPILMLSSGTQSASSFFMLWLAALFLSDIVELKTSTSYAYEA